MLSLNFSLWMKNKKPKKTFLLCKNWCKIMDLENVFSLKRWWCWWWNAINKHSANSITSEMILLSLNDVLLSLTLVDSHCKSWSFRFAWIFSAKILSHPKWKFIKNWLTHFHVPLLATPDVIVACISRQSLNDGPQDFLNIFRLFHITLFNFSWTILIEKKTQCSVKLSAPSAIDWSKFGNVLNDWTE